MADYPMPLTGTQAPAVDYGKMGQNVSNSINSITEGLKGVIGGYQMVNDSVNKNKLKNQALAEMQQKAPHLLEYLDIKNMPFEKLAKGLHQVAITRGLYEQAERANPGEQMGSLESWEKLAIAADDKNFQTIVKNLTEKAESLAKDVKNQKMMQAIQTGAAAGGTLQKNVRTALQAPGSEYMDPKEGIDLLKKSGVDENILAKEETKKKVSEDKLKAASLRQKATDRHRRRMAGLSELQNVNMIQKAIDDQQTDMISASRMIETARKTEKQLNEQVTEQREKIAKLKSNMKTFDPKKEAEMIQGYEDKIEAAKANLINLDRLIEEQQETILMNENTLNIIGRNQLEFKKAVLKVKPQFKSYFDKWQQRIEDAEEAGSETTEPISPAPIATPPVPSNLKKTQAPTPAPAPTRNIEELAKAAYENSRKEGNPTWEQLAPNQKAWVISKVK